MDGADSLDRGLTMRPARPDEAARVLEILEDGKRAIARFGIGQWQQGYPDRAAVERDMALGRCRVAEDRAGALVGALALCPGADPEYAAVDAGWLTANPAAGEVPYASIHRCATAASAARTGVMGFMFRAAEDEARAAGLQSIRIDTHPGNLAMRSFLARAGYTELGRFELARKPDETDLTRIAYEKLLD